MEIKQKRYSNRTGFAFGEDSKPGVEIIAVRSAPEEKVQQTDNVAT